MPTCSVSDRSSSHFKKFLASIHIKSFYNFKYLNIVTSASSSCQSHSSELNVFKLLELDEANSSYNLFRYLGFFIFVFDLPEVRSISCNAHVLLRPDGPLDFPPPDEGGGVFEHTHTHTHSSNTPPPLSRLLRVVEQNEKQCLKAQEKSI